MANAGMKTQLQDSSGVEMTHISSHISDTRENGIIYLNLLGH